MAEITPVTVSDLRYIVNDESECTFAEYIAANAETMEPWEIVEILKLEIGETNWFGPGLSCKRIS